MRSVFRSFGLCFAISLGSGCSDPQCRPNELKVGSMCYPNPAARLDGAVDVESAGRSATDGSIAEPTSDTGALPVPSPFTADATPPVQLQTVVDAATGDCDGAAKNECGGCAVLANPKGAVCAAGFGACFVSGEFECVDTNQTACNATAGSPEPEACDGIDNDCDGTDDNGLQNACGGPCAQPVPEERCDGTDNDCDGLVDEGLLPNLIVDSSFENQTDRVGPPWGTAKGVFVSNDAHRGSQAVTVVAEPGNETSVPGWNDFSQTISVDPGTTYRIEVWVKTSANVTYGRVGARDNPDWMVELAPDWGKTFGALSDYTYESTLFTAGSTTTKADIYIGVSSAGERTSITVDDVVVSLLQCKK